MRSTTLFLFLFLVSQGADAVDKMRTPLLMEVPLVNQSTNYSCGPAAMASALGYYGKDLNESDLITTMGATPDYGVGMEAMWKFAKKQSGIKAWIRTGLKVQDLVDHLNKKQVAIIEAQAWAENLKQPYSQTWDEGHYMVVIGVSEKNVYFMDPSLLGSRGFIPIPEFEDRWHDISVGEQKWHHTALFLEGRPKPPAIWQKVE